jgi:peptide/nickel transport system permease protein
MTLNYFVRRVFFLIMVVWTAASINFILPRLAGRDPIKEQMLMQIASQGRKQEDAEQMIRTYTRLFGLDKPLWQQYLTYIGNVLRLDFGYSINNYPRTVMEIIIPRVASRCHSCQSPSSPHLSSGSCWALSWAGTAPQLGQQRHCAAHVGVFFRASLPGGALVLIYFVAFRMRLLPMNGAYPRTMVEDWGNLEFLLGYARHAILPILSLVFVDASSWALGMRAMMVTVEGEDYATFAEAKGLKTGRIFFRYLLRNALLPSLTGLALRLGFIITGAAVAETFFNYNGLGSTLGAAITQFDFFLLYGIIIIMVMSIALATFVMDMIYPLLDPRITYRKQRG